MRPAKEEAVLAGAVKRNIRTPEQRPAALECAGGRVGTRINDFRRGSCRNDAHYAVQRRGKSPAVVAAGHDKGNHGIARAGNISLLRPRSAYLELMAISAAENGRKGSVRPHTLVST